MTRNEINQLRAGCSILQIKPATGRLNDLPLATRCRIAKEHAFYRMCQNVAILVFLIIMMSIAGGFDIG